MSCLYSRNYRMKYTEDEKIQYHSILELEKTDTFTRINHYPQYPEAVRHYSSLFPNYHIDAFDWTRRDDFDDIIDGYEELIHDKECTETQTQQYIKMHSAYFMILSLLRYYDFGHHEAYIFPEFRLGNDYIPDYLLIGKNSGGYEFAFVELEAPHGSIAIHKQQYLGKNARDGLNQINDWKRWLEGHFGDLKRQFKKELGEGRTLPTEFEEYDSSRIHYMIVAGTRDDFSDEIYSEGRTKHKESDIQVRHFDNIVDTARNLKTSINF